MSMLTDPQEGDTATITEITCGLRRNPCHVYATFNWGRWILDTDVTLTNRRGDTTTAHTIHPHQVTQLKEDTA